jgi:hypothetical protein
MVSFISSIEPLDSTIRELVKYLFYKFYDIISYHFDIQNGLRPTQLNQWVIQLFVRGRGRGVSAAKA